jgi:hypothetical protein
MSHRITVEIPAGVPPMELGLMGALVAETVEQRIGGKVRVDLDVDPDSWGGRLRQAVTGDLPEPETPGVTRQQECKADAMAAKYGRSAVNRQSDGSVVVTGILDDVEMETVCLEQDGRERWRR